MQPKTKTMKFDREQVTYRLTLQLESIEIN